MNKKAQRIAKLNDEFRASIGTDNETGHIVKTEGIATLPVNDQMQILTLVKTFNDFSKGNDPYGEHDFGKVEHNGHKAFWKIDYYDKDDMQCGSEFPEDADKTARVMTVMLTHEY